jgi:pyruvate dehydrogenase E2 component (dihydrolipoamide acetyltransferase)/2-oxoisovalerate dehydrogenase E2 component (dihydrolipoyl transacylase)
MTNDEAAMDFPLPPVGEGLFEVELVRWLVKPGEAVHRGQGLAELMSDKATMELPAPFAGTVSETLAAEGSKVKVGQVILRYEADGERPGSTPPSETTSSQPAPAKVEAAARNGGVEPRRSPGVAVLDRPLAPVAAPSVRHLARKLGVDLGKVRGTGPAGRVLLDDLTAFIAPKAAPADKHVKGPDRDPTHGLELGVPGTRTKLAGLRRKIAEKMVTSVHTIPHYSYIDECEITDLVRLRGQIKDTLAAAGVKMTYLPFMVKAVARALKDVPAVNATFDEATEEVTLHAHYHVGIAVAAPNGLVVPVVKDADKKDVAAIATEIDRLSKDVRAGRPKIDDLRGATFTITSIGNIGGLISTPIINHPEVGIMGIGKVVRRPVYDAHGDLRPADLVYLSFSFDHRVLDGAVGAAFGNAVIRHLQNPATLLLPERFGV